MPFRAFIHQSVSLYLLPSAGLLPPHPALTLNAEATPLLAWGSLLFSCSGAPASLWPCGLKHARLPCPSPSPGVLKSLPGLKFCASVTSPESEMLKPHLWNVNTLLNRSAAFLFSFSDLTNVLTCFSPVLFFVILWTVAGQAPLSMRLYRQE